MKQGRYFTVLKRTTFKGSRIGPEVSGAGKIVFLFVFFLSFFFYPALWRKQIRIY